jgi:hypothetical protein
MLATVASTVPTSFDWDEFRAKLRGYPFSRIEWLAGTADVDPDWLRDWLRAEVWRRRREARRRAMPPANELANGREETRPT